MEKIRQHRLQVMESAKTHQLSNVRVFGSVARGQAGNGSDIDILVHPAPTASIFDLAAFMADVQQIVGAPVDVLSDCGTGPLMDRIRNEAIPL